MLNVLKSDFLFNAIKAGKLALQFLLITLKNLFSKSIRSFCGLSESRFHKLRADEMLLFDSLIVGTRTRAVIMTND